MINIDLLKYDTNHKYAEFLNNMTSFGFLPHILQPTIIEDYSASVIDNIYSNNLDQDSESGNVLVKFADHFSQLLSVNKVVAKSKHFNIYKRDYSNFNSKSFVDDINIQNWCSYHSDVNAGFNDFLWRVEGCVNRHAPIKKLNKKQVKKCLNLGLVLIF